MAFRFTNISTWFWFPALVMSLSVPPGYYQVNGTQWIVPLYWPALLYEENKLWMIGIILSAVIYIGLLSLALSYVPLLLKNSCVNSRGMRIFLLIYVVFMVTVSTVYIVTAIIALKKSLPVDYSNALWNNDTADPDWFQNGYAGGVCITFASWGADGFMASKFSQRQRRHFELYSRFLYSSGDVRWYTMEFHDHVE